jgi:hypothetical protein
MSEEAGQDIGKSSMVNTAEALLIETLGIHFVAYVTATEPDVIHERLTSGESQRLTESQENILSILVQTVASLATAQERSHLLRMDLVNVLGAFESRSQTSVANTLRIEAGGVVWEPSVEEDVKQEILIQLRDIYPVLLLPVENSPYLSHVRDLGISFHRHPRSLNVEQALLAHPVLSRMFPDQNPHTGRTGRLITSAGNGGGVQLSMFSSELIKAGWEIALLSFAHPSVEDHVHGFEVALDTVIGALQGKSTSIPVKMGLTGVLFPEGVETLDLGWAQLRVADDRDLNPAIEASVPGALQAADAEGKNVEVKYRGDLIMQTSIPYRIKIGEVDLADDWPEGFNPHKLIQKRVQNVQLGLVLSNDLEPRTVVLQSWMRILDPLFMGSFSSKSPQLMRNIYPHRLSGEQVADWKRWAVLVAENRQKSIDIAIRRVLSAISERNTPEDMLVDAVIVWENLFGARQETTMRVTASLAWLLGSGIEDRKHKQSQYKRIYELRSGVVHGSIDELRKAEDRNRPVQALETAISALRIVFKDRPDLLGEADSALRSNRLLLGD